MTEFDSGDIACYSIRMPGTLGPLLLCSLRRKGVVRLASATTTWTVDMSVEDADLVDVAQKFAEYGVEIESVREVDSNTQ